MNFRFNGILEVLMESVQFLIFRPWKRKRNSKQKDSRSLEAENKDILCKLLGTSDVTSCRKGLFFVARADCRALLENKTKEEIVNVESFSLSIKTSLSSLETAVASFSSDEPCSLALTCNQGMIGHCTPGQLFQQVSAKIKCYDTNAAQTLVIDVGDDDIIYVGMRQMIGAETKHVLNSLEKLVRRNGSTLVVLVKYAEVFLRGQNRGACVEDLRQAVATRVGNLARSVVSIHDQFIVVIPSEPADAAAASRVETLCSTVPGVKRSVVALAVANNLNSLHRAVSQALAELDQTSISSVRLHCKIRKGLQDISDAELLRVCAPSNFSIPVVQHKKAQVNVVIESTRECFFLRKGMGTLGVGGLPVDSHRSVVCLLSGGLDSPVAAFCMQKRGARVVLVHCVNAAAMDSSAVIDKIERLAEKLAQFQARLCLVVVPFGQLQDVLIASIPAEERMLCYRHCMTRVASLVADQRGSSLIATGDSYGQVASQTPSNLRAIYALSPIPIISPLISHDKVEIIEIAKKIGTYELSILPYGDCCSFFLADHPKLHFRDRKPEESLSMLLSSVPNLTTLISDAVARSQIIKFRQRNGLIEKKFQGERIRYSVSSQVCMFRTDLPTTLDLPHQLQEQLPLTPIYLDAAATTFCDSSTIKVISGMMEREANPNSVHAFGRDAWEKLDAARQTIASLLKCKAQELVFSAGASDSNRLAVVQARNAVLCLSTDHSSMTMQVAKENQIRVSQSGHVDLVHLQELLESKRPSLISFCYGNNETGVAVAWKDMLEVRDRVLPTCLVHADLSQSFCKMDVSSVVAKVDLATISSHKVHGPKGIGALFVREGVRLADMFFGTPSVALAFGFAHAVSLAFPLFDYGSFKTKLVKLLLQKVPGAEINGDWNSSTIPILSVRIRGVESAQLVSLASSKYKVMISAGSACSSTKKASHVLLAMHLNVEETIRISFSRQTSESDLEEGVNRIADAVKELACRK